MGQWENFWSVIAVDIRNKFSRVHKGMENAAVNDWQKSTILDFLDHLESEVRLIIATNDRKAKLCGVTGKESADEFRAMDYTTFLKIFHYKVSEGRKVTRDIFAIYLGYDSAEAYWKNNKLAEAFEHWKKQVEEDEKWNPVQLILNTEFSKPELYQPVYLSVLDKKSKLMTYEAGEIREFQLSQSLYQGGLEAISIHSLLTDISQWSILIGVPGSGKTSSMKWLLQQVMSGRYVDYDQALYLSLADLDDFLQRYPNATLFTAFFYIYLNYEFEEAESTGYLLQKSVAKKTETYCFY